MTSCVGVGVGADVAQKGFSAVSAWYSYRAATEPVKLECPGWAVRFDIPDSDIDSMSEALLDQHVVYQCSREHYCLDTHSDDCRELLH